MSNFLMVCHLHGDPLYIHAKHVLTSASPSARSWFFAIKDICLQYALPHPLDLLETPPNKILFKKLIRQKVLDFWESKLAEEALALTSLKYFDPSIFNLRKPSLHWLYSTNKSYECAKTTVVARMLSGRYRTENLCRHWGSSNHEGFCLATTCTDVVEDLVHILVECPALETVRNRMIAMWLERSDSYPSLHQMLKMVVASPPDIITQFVLTPWCFDGVSMLAEIYGQAILDHIIYLTRTYAYHIHRERLMQRGQWPG